MGIFTYFYPEIDTFLVWVKLYPVPCMLFNSSNTFSSPASTTPLGTNPRGVALSA